MNGDNPLPEARRVGPGPDSFFQEYLKSTDIDCTAQSALRGVAVLGPFMARGPLADSAALKQQRNIS